METLTITPQTAASALHLGYIQSALKSHGVDALIRDNELWALEEWTRNGVYACKWVNATHWTKTDLLNFLNY